MLRGVNYLSFLALSLRAGMKSARPDVVLCMSDPPFISLVGVALARRFSVPLVVVTQDVFPEIAVKLGRIENRLVVLLLDLLVRFGLTRADRVVAIGDTMRGHLQAKGVAGSRIDVVPNWTDTTEIVPRPRDNTWAQEQGLTERFVVMHSGNVGYAQDLASLIRAGTYLRDLEDLALVIIGSGALHAELVRLAAELEVDALRFLPYQPRERLSESLSSADIHVVGLARGLAGYVVPSRIYGVLAAGRPVVVAADETSETARLVRDVGCGVVVAPGRPDLLADAIRRARAGVLPLGEMGARARAYAEREARRDVAVARYRALLEAQVREGSTCRSPSFPRSTRR